MNTVLLHQRPDPGLEVKWHAFLRETPFACHYLSSAFFDEPQFREKRPFVLLVQEGDRVVGAASGIVDDGQMTCGLQSRPQVAFCDDIDLPTAVSTLDAALKSALNDGRGITLYTWKRIDAFAALGYSERQYSGDGGILLLDLTLGPDALFRAFSESRRTNIRKAIKRGVTVTQASQDEEFEEYYEIYRTWCGEKGFPPAPYDQYRETLKLRDNRRLFVARYEGKMVAGVIVRFVAGGLIEFAANSSVRDDRLLRPNDLLHWEIIRWATGEGYRTYSLGGAHTFLRRFGGTEISTYRYRCDLTLFKREELRETVMRGLGAAWKRLPESVRTRIRS